eukprot:1161934-Pelagomonas_calceolata.AAC.8
MEMHSLNCKQAWGRGKESKDAWKRTEKRGGRFLFCAPVPAALPSFAAPLSSNTAGDHTVMHCQSTHCHITASNACRQVHCLKCIATTHASSDCATCHNSSLSTCSSKRKRVLPQLRAIKCTATTHASSDCATCHNSSLSTCSSKRRLVPPQELANKCMPQLHCRPPPAAIALVVYHYITATTGP